jgi:recombination protein RecA
MKLNDVLAGIEKKLGKDIIVGNKVDVEFVSSGSIGLDFALGGGFAKGRVVECYGWESSGKTTIALHLAAEIQKLGGCVAYIDMEQAMDLEYAQNLGVEIDFDSKDKFLLSQPDNGEAALELVRELLKAEKVQLIVFDSVGALNPKAKLQGDVGDSKMGLEARLMSSTLPMLISEARKTGCIILFINQKREKIGVMFGNPETTMGGNALKFYASQRLDVSRFGQEKDGDEVTANKTRVKVMKNKVAPPFKKAEFNIEFGVGIDKVAELVDLAVECEIIKKSGSWYSYGDTKLGQGSTGVKSILQDNPELFEEIDKKVRINLGLLQE